MKKRKPKFKVREVVALREYPSGDVRYSRISKVLKTSACFIGYGYQYQLYDERGPFTESEIRPLTKRERGA